MQQPIQVFGALRGGPAGAGAGQPTALLPFSGPPPAGRPGEDREWLDPVFVSFAARSGSTLTRFLLDAHPDLACPPETNLPELCARLVRMWSLLTAAPTAASLDEPLEVQDLVAAGIRRTVGMMIGPYLAKRGKQRYCDKSLHVAKHAELLLRVFPRARFVCLYRHPMDVIASGIEACPWGLKDFGFDPYAAGSPGNSVLAIARYWADYTAAALALEDKYPERCHRVRYEDLVTDPEITASGIFEFIGVPPAPGISTSCFAPDRERLGRGDFKIWNTSKISADSVGRGWSVPAFQIDPTVTARLNELADRLGYARIERSWGAGPTPADLRVPADGGPAAQPRAAVPAATRPMPRALLLLGEHLQAGLLRVSDRFARRWEPYSAESFMITATSQDSADVPVRWRVDLAARTVALDSGAQADQSANDLPPWQVVGSAEAWERVLSGRDNLGVVLRQRELRYCDTGEATSLGIRRIAMLADLLGLTPWRSQQAAGQSQPVPAA